MCVCVCACSPLFCLPRVPLSGEKSKYMKIVCLFLQNFFVPHTGICQFIGPLFMPCVRYMLCLYSQLCWLCIAVLVPRGKLSPFVERVSGLLCKKLSSCADMLRDHYSVVSVRVVGCGFVLERRISASAYFTVHISAYPLFFLVSTGEISEMADAE